MKHIKVSIGVLFSTVFWCAGSCLRRRLGMRADLFMVTLRHRGQWPQLKSVTVARGESISVTLSDRIASGATLSVTRVRGELYARPAFPSKPRFFSARHPSLSLNHTEERWCHSHCCHHPPHYHSMHIYFSADIFIRVALTILYPST